MSPCVWPYVCQPAAGGLLCFYVDLVGVQDSGASCFTYPPFCDTYRLSLPAAFCSFLSPTVACCVFFVRILSHQRVLQQREEKSSSANHSRADYTRQCHRAFGLTFVNQQREACCVFASTLWVSRIQEQVASHTRRFVTHTACPCLPPSVVFCLPLSRVAFFLRGYCPLSLSSTLEKENCQAPITVVPTIRGNVTVRYAERLSTNSGRPAVYLRRPCGCPGFRSKLLHIPAVL